MKIAVIFYSFSGNTKQAVSCLEQALRKQDNEAALLRLKPLVESDKFISQSAAALMQKEVKLETVEHDLSNCDLLVFASPVWAFTITPALRSYINSARGIQNKPAAVILTYGSGAGVHRSFRQTKKLLNAKGATVKWMIPVKGGKVNDNHYLEQQLKPLISLKAPLA